MHNDSDPAVGVDEPLTAVSGPERRSTFVGTAPARRRRAAIVTALAVGSVALAATVRVEPDSAWFIALALLLAATWAIGALAAGPIPLRPIAPRRWVAVLVGSASVGVAAYVVFLVAYLIAREVPVVSSALDNVLDKRSERGLIVLAIAALTGFAEELFFRGALYGTGSHRPVLRTTAVYVAVTAVTGNIALVVAAAVMGIVLAVARRATGSVLSPIVIHLTWSTLMLLALPR